MEGGNKYLQDKALIESRLTNHEAAISSLTAGQESLRNAMVAGQDRALERMDKGFNALSSKIDAKFTHLEEKVDAGSTERSNLKAEVATVKASALTTGRAVGILFAAATILTAIVFGIAELIK